MKVASLNVDIVWDEYVFREVNERVLNYIHWYQGRSISLSLNKITTL